VEEDAEGEFLAGDGQGGLGVFVFCYGAVGVQEVVGPGVGVMEEGFACWGKGDEVVGGGGWFRFGCRG
jgi:hypothetical protein